MKLHYAVCIYLLLVLLPACTSNEKATKQDTLKPPPVVADTVLPPNFYKRLEGTIAGRPVVMHLKRTGDQWDGIYYYEQQGRWLHLTFERDSSSDNRYYFQEYTPVQVSKDENTPLNYFHFSYNNDVLKGTWQRGDGKKSYPLTLKENYPDGSYTFQTLSYEDAIAAFPDKGAGPEAKVGYFYLKASGTGKEYKWLNKQLRSDMNIIGPDTAVDWTAELRQLTLAYFRDYREEAKNFENEKSLPAFLNYESNTDINIRFNDNGFVVVEHTAYDYSGGAHGNWGSNLICMDVAQQKVMELKDVIQADAQQLQPLVEHAFRRQYGLQPTDSLNMILFEDRLLPNQNFYITSKGLGFIYNPYEVAAYVMGQVFVFIPYDELKPYMNPEFKKRMQL